MVEKVKKRNGRLEDFDVNKINECVVRACEGIEEVSASEVVLDAQVQMQNKIPTAEIDKALIYSAIGKIYKEPNYSLVGSRLLLNTLYKEVFGEGVDCDAFELQYQKAFLTNIKLLVKREIFNPQLIEKFDLKRLAEAIDPERDKKFDYVGSKTLYDRYLTKLDGRVKETPQAFLMRVAMGLSINEEDPTEMAIKFYDVYSNQLALSSTPTLFNSGTRHSQLSSCFLSTFEDSIDGIYGGFHQQARLSKFAGGLGNDFTPLRAEGSYIKGTNGKSTGIIPWFKNYDALLLGVNQGGRRKGSGVGYLEPWHKDYPQFLDLRKVTGDDRRRTHDTNTAVWMNDMFMKLTENPEADWYYFCPSEAPDLHETYGKEFEKLYHKYIEKAEAGELKNWNKVNAKGLWKKTLMAIFETGHPWVTFKDPCNMRSPQDHVGVVHSSNLCTEITLNTAPSRYDARGNKTAVGETAVCNLASIILINHLLDNGEMDWDRLKDTIHTTIRALDNVIDINFYPTDETENSNFKHRPIGLGSMGWADLMMAKGIPYDSDEAKELTDRIQEFISYHAILASSLLAKEKGRYSTYEGSKWDRGILPQDSYVESQKERFGEVVEAGETLDWQIVRDSIKQHGMRNSNVMAIAPTATIGKIAGCSASIDPSFSVLYVKEDMSGNFTISNKYFVAKMKELGLWTPPLQEAMKKVNGDVLAITLPEEIQAVFKRAYNHDMHKMIEIGAMRQKWIDQAQSFNLFYEGDSLKEIDAIYKKAWRSGLKTTYYFRTVSATRIEQTSIAEIPEPTMTVTVPLSACKIDDPDCESCQ